MNKIFATILAVATMNLLFFLGFSIGYRMEPPQEVKVVKIEQYGGRIINCDITMKENSEISGIDFVDGCKVYLPKKGQGLLTNNFFRNGKKP